MSSFAYYSEEEINILKRDYGALGANIKSLLKRHSIGSIRAKASSLGLTRTAKIEKPYRPAWTDKELQLLRDNYSICGTNIPELRKTRTESAIVNKAFILGLKYQRWSEEEEQALSEGYAVYGIACSGLSSRHSEIGIRSKAHNMRLKRKKRDLQEHARVGTTWNRWTKKELNILVKKYPTCGTNIPELLRTHTKAAIVSRASSLDLTCGHMPQISTQQRWSDADIAILRQKYPTLGVNIPELSSRFTESAIRSKANRLGIYSKLFWTEEQIDLLKEKYPVQGSSIPELLKYHSPISILSKACSLHLHKECYEYANGIAK